MKKNTKLASGSHTITAECLTLKRLLLGNMTYKQFADKLGISENNLNFKINGKRGWWLDECILAVKILGKHELREVFPEAFEKYGFGNAMPKGAYI